MIKNNDSNIKNTHDVRTKLLDAAECLFASHGFEGTSVRQITKEADCNVASINYYFSSKENLYYEMFRRRLHTMLQIRLESINNVMANREEATLEKLLGAFAYAFLEPFMDEVSGKQLMELMVREMIDPMLPKNIFIDEMIGPVLDLLMKAILELCPGLDESETMLSIMSFIGQLLQSIHFKEFSKHKEVDMLELDYDKVVKHIVKFSTAGIRAYAQGE